MQTIKRHEKRSPSLPVKDTGKGWGAFLTTESATHRSGPVIFKIERIDIPESEEEKQWLAKQKFKDTAEDAYTG